MRDRRGQSTAEVALVLAVAIAAFLVMQIYMKRGISGKLRSATDQIGDQFTPYTATYKWDRNFKTTRTEDTTAQGQTTTGIANEAQTRNSGTENPVDTAMKDETLFFKGQ